MSNNPDSRGIGTVRYHRLVPKDDECAQKRRRYVEFDGKNMEVSPSNLPGYYWLDPNVTLQVLSWPLGRDCP